MSWARVVLVVGIVLGGTFGSGAPATALSPGDDSRARSDVDVVQPTPELPKCWTEIDSGKSACAASDRELAQKILDDFNLVVVSSGTATQLTDASSESARSNEVVPMATWVLGQVWADRNYAGYSRTFSTSRANPCAQAGNYTDAYWSFDAIYILNDNIESVAPLSPCRIQLWADANSGGSTTGQIGTTADLAGFRNVASSLQFSR